MVVVTALCECCLDLSVQSPHSITCQRLQLFSFSYPADKFDQDYVTILFAKAFQCLQMKAFDQARELLQSARTHCGNLPHGGKRIAAIADWETLLVGLVQYRYGSSVNIYFSRFFYPPSPALPPFDPML